MKLVYDALTAIEQDIVATQLHQETKNLIVVAKKRLEQLAQILHDNVRISHQYQKQIMAAQPTRFRGFKEPPGRFLSREIDMYETPNNLRFTSKCIDPECRNPNCVKS